MDKLRRFFNADWFLYLVLLAVITMAYGLLANEMGFAWDGWPFTWIAETFGNEGLTRYFSTNRPVWGLLYKITTPVIGSNAFAWQIFAIFTRWICTVAFYKLLTKLWPAHKSMLAWAAILFSVYPGFGQHSIAIVYGHFYIVLAISFLSLWAMLKALESPKYFWPYIFLSLASSGYAIFATEYFFGLEILRPFILLIYFRQQGSSIKESIKQAFKIWWAFGVLVLVYLIWRIFILSFHLYDPTLITEVADTPFERIINLIITMFQDVFISGIQAWVAPITVLLNESYNSMTSLLHLALLAAGTIGLVIFFLMRTLKDEVTNSTWLVTGFGLAALFICGLPIWIPGLDLGLTFPANRFTLPMMFGSSIFISGLCFALIRNKYFRTVLLAVLAGLAISMQFHYSVDFRQDWKYQQAFFQQLTWRAPSITPGTTLISTEIEQFKSTDNSLTAPLNWIYSPENETQAMDYLLAYVPLRIEEGVILKNLSPGNPVEVDYLAARFKSDTDHILVLYYNAPACVRIMSPLYDLDYPYLVDDIEDILYLSRPDELIQPEPQAELPAEAFTIPSNENTWCYYFQKADLARQFGDWETVAELGDIGLNLSDSPNHATERLPFVEGYAMTQQWKKAVAQTETVLEINPATNTMLCNIWQRVAEQHQHETITTMIEVTCE